MNQRKKGSEFNFNTSLFAQNQSIENKDKNKEQNKNTEPKNHTNALVALLVKAITVFLYHIHKNRI